jgi:hypothetical protein
MKTPDRVQLTCPYCKKEFPFNNGWLDKEYEAEKTELQRLTREISVLKAQPYSVQRKNEGKIKALGLRIQDCQMRCTALRKVRKLKDQQLENYKFLIYRRIIAEKFGQEFDIDVTSRALQELEAYKISGLMWHEYTKARYKKGVTSIGKL